MVEVPDYSFISKDTGPSLSQSIGNWQGIQKNALEIQDKQADTAWGNALQQATDAQGNVDYPKAQALAARDLMARQGMLRALAVTSRLTLEQQSQASIHFAQVAALTPSIIQNPSDQNVNLVFDNYAQSSHLPKAQVDAERNRWLAMPQAQRQEAAKQYGMGALDALGRLHYGQGGTPTSWETGGGYQGGTYDPVTGALKPAGAPVAKTLTPEGAMQYGITYPATADDVAAGRAKSTGETVHVPGPDVIKRFGYGGLLPPGAQIETPPSGGGVVGADGKPVSPTNPPRLLKVPGAPSVPPVVPYQGTGTGTSADTTPIYQPPAGAPAAPSVAPQSPPPATPAPPPAPPVVAPPVSNYPAMTPGPRAALQGGVPVTSTNALVPNLGAASPPSPAVAGDVNAILGGMARARASGPQPGTQVAGASFATGPGYDEQVTAKTSQDRLASDTNLAANYANNVFPQTQALALLGRGMTTGPTTDLLNTAKGWASGVARSMGYTGPISDDVASYDALHKWLSQIVAGNPVAQGSDARLAATLAGNANTGIHELASADMLKAGIALMRMNATASSEWASNPAIRAQYGYYTNYLRDFNKTVDPRAFAWDMYNPAQKKDLLADIDKHDEAYAQRLRDSLQMVRRNGYMGETRAMPGG